MCRRPSPHHWAIWRDLFAYAWHLLHQDRNGEKCSAGLSWTTELIRYNLRPSFWSCLVWINEIGPPLTPGVVGGHVNVLWLPLEKLTLSIEVEWTPVSPPTKFISGRQDLPEQLQFSQRIWEALALHPFSLPKLWNAWHQKQPRRNIPQSGLMNRMWWWYFSNALWNLR